MKKTNFNLLQFVSLLLAIAMLPLFAACTGNGETTTDAGSIQDTEPIPEAVPLTLAEDGKVTVRVIRGFNATDEEVSAAKSVRNALAALFPDSVVEIADDFSKDKTYNSETVEILVGRTEYPQSEAAYEALPYGDYGVAFSGNKILLLAWSPTVLPMLASDFCDSLRKAVSKDGKSLVLSPSVCGFQSFSNELSAIPVADIKLTSMVSAGDGAYQLYYSPATPENLSSYLDKLKATGFESVSDRDVGSNRFCSLTGKNTAVTAYYTDTNKTFRVIVEPIGNYYGTGTASAEKKVSPSLTMIGRRFSDTSTYLNCDAGAGLMCFLIQLSDGRFIVIDGGVTDGTLQSYSQALYSKMYELAPDKNNIVIAGWFFTHSHSDHIGGFRSFSASYSGKVKLEAILNNFPSEADHKVSNEKNDYSNFKAAINSYWNKVPHYKLHTGQRISMGDAVVEILYTPEDFVTAKRTISSVTNNWNNTSLIFSVEIAGQKLMFLGDAQEVPNNLTAAVYGSYLKSDICQIAHHGGIGGTEAIYQKIDPEVAMFSTTDVLVPVYIQKFTYNYYLINQLHVREYWNAADRIKTFELPYHATGSGFMK